MLRGPLSYRVSARTGWPGSVAAVLRGPLSYRVSARTGWPGSGGCRAARPLELQGQR